MKPISLLSENDWRKIASWLRKLKEDAIEAELGDYKVRVSTSVAPRVANVAMFVRVEQWYRGIYSSQYFESTEEARR